MLFAGCHDGVYRVPDFEKTAASTPDRVLESGRVMRVSFTRALDGFLAATRSGLYYSPDGVTWTTLGVPTEHVYSAGVSPDGDTLYAGTRPAHVYVTHDDPENAIGGDGLEWRKLSGFDDLPSRGEWRLPRHENLAQVRDVHVPNRRPDHVIAGVEVGGVHLSEDGGETWTERKEGVNDDVHELCVLDSSEYVAATGFGLFRTTDAGRTWARLDDDVPQRYFRAVLDIDGVVYAAGAMANSSTWDDEDADPALYRSDRGDALAPVDFPYPDETVTGMTAVDDDLVAATHRGHVLVKRPDGWDDVGRLPVPDEPTGSYNPLCWVEA